MWSQPTATLAAMLLLGSTNAHVLKHQHLPRDLAITNNLPADWSYLGCRTDSVHSRTLPLEYYAADDMTQEKCIQHCVSKGYSFAGVEYSHECFCGNQLADGATTAPEADCKMPCGGLDGEACGGPDRINIFVNSKGPAQVNQSPSTPNWQYLGCYSDKVSSRTLSSCQTVEVNTVDNCIAKCASEGYTYAGLEYAHECYCGNDILAPSTQISASLCSMPCSGKTSELCGGPDALNLYQAKPANPNCPNICASPTQSATGRTFKKIQGSCGLFVHGYNIWRTTVYSSSLSDCEAVQKCATDAATNGASSYTTYRPSWEATWRCDMGLHTSENGLYYTAEPSIVYNSYLFLDTAPVVQPEYSD